MQSYRTEDEQKAIKKGHSSFSSDTLKSKWPGIVCCQTSYQVTVQYSGTKVERIKDITGSTQ